MKTWKERKIFVKSLVEKVDIKQRTTGESSRKKFSYSYHLLVNDQRHQVCKKLFCSTLGIPERTVMRWVTEENSNDLCTENASPRQAPNKLNEEDNEFLIAFLNSIATVPSHYCRAAYRNRKFMEPGTTLSSLFKLYQKKAADEGVRSACYTLFNKRFHALGFSVFVPRKDQCDMCVKHKVGAISDADHALHLQLKNAAQKEKENDK